MTSSTRGCVPGSTVAAGRLRGDGGFGMSLKEPDPRHPELDIANAYSGTSACGTPTSSPPASRSASTARLRERYTEGGLVMARLGRRFAAGHMVDLSYGHSVYR